MVRVAIIGMGFMGCTHYKAYDAIDGVQVTVIADRKPAKAAGDLSGQWGNIGDGKPPVLDMSRITGTTDLEAPLTMDDVDVIDICLATPVHVDYAVKALASGKHVICEKPLAASYAEAKPIAEAAAQAKGFFMPAMCMRFWPQWAWLKQAVDEQRYGKVLGATFRRVASMPPGWFKDGDISGGAAMDLHIHDTDFIHYLLGKPSAVTSQGYTHTSGKIDHLVTQYHYDDVPMVQAEGGWAMAEGFDFTMRYTVNFEHATADFDIARADAPLRLHQQGQATAIDCGQADGYQQELAYFADCVSKNQKPTLIDIDQAMTSMRIVEAESQSIQTGTKVTIA